MAGSDYPEGTTGTDSYEDDYASYEKRSPRKSKRRFGEIVTTIVVIIIITLLLLLILDAGFRESVKDMFGAGMEGYREYPEWAEFDVERRIVLTPNPQGSLMSYSVDIPTPEDIGENETLLQDVRSVTANPDRSESKYPNYDWMVWEGTDVSSQQVLTIRYSMYTESAVWSMDSADSGTVNDYPKWLTDRFGNETRDEWRILPTHPQIQTLSSQLTTGKITVYDKLKSMFDYMNDNYDYEVARSGEPKWCYETLSDRRGDCDDQSVLFISLARAAGIPAKLEFGALYNSQEKAWGGHAWVKVYIPLYSQGTYDVFWFNIDIVNDHFLFRDAYRFSEWESDGNGTHLEDYYYSYGSNFLYDESYTTLNIRKSSNTIKISESGRPVDETIPGFEGVLVLPAILSVALILKKRRKGT